MYFATIVCLETLTNYHGLHSKWDGFLFLNIISNLACDVDLLVERLGETSRIHRLCFKVYIFCNIEDETSFAYFYEEMSIS